MKQKLLFTLLAVALCATGWAQTPQWERDAGKLDHTLRTLDTLLSVNPFIEDVPGLETAIGNNVNRVINDLNTLKATLEAEIGTLSAEGRANALTALAQLLLKTADTGQRLNNRALYSLTLTLATNYNNSYAAYFQLAGQYNIATRRLPIGVILADRGGWSIPG